jgi:hypothetical protein
MKTPHDLNVVAAIAEAKKLLGPRANACRRAGQCEVGVIDDNGVWTIVGEGADFREALEDARLRTKAIHAIHKVDPRLWLRKAAGLCEVGIEDLVISQSESWDEVVEKALAIYAAAEKELASRT